MFISMEHYLILHHFKKHCMWASLISITGKLNEQPCYIFLNRKRKSIFVSNFNADNYHQLLTFINYAFFFP